MFERYRRADLSKADPKAVAGIVTIDKWMTRNQQAIELVLTSPHWPRHPHPSKSTCTRSSRAWATVAGFSATRTASTASCA